MPCARQAEGAEGSLAESETDQREAWSRADPRPAEAGRGMSQNNLEKISIKRKNKYFLGLCLINNSLIPIIFPCHKVAGTTGVLEFIESFGFNLADTLAGDIKCFAYFF